MFMFRFIFIIVLQSPKEYSEGDLPKETRRKVWLSYSLYQNTTIKRGTLEKIGCLLKKRSTNRTFLWSKNANLGNIGKKIDFNMNTSYWLFILDIKDEMQDIQLWEWSYVPMIIMKKISYNCTFT